MAEYGDNGDVKLDILQKELDKITQKREITEQLSDRVQKGISWYDAYGSLVLAIIIVSMLFVSAIAIYW